MTTNRNCASRSTKHHQLLASAAAALLVLPFASRAPAQSGGPGKDWGVVTSIDDLRLEVRNGSHTTTYIETNHTRWLNSKGQSIEPGDVVGKNVQVRFQWTTDGSEALEVRVVGSNTSKPVHNSARTKPDLDSAEPFMATWHRSDGGNSMTISFRGDTAIINYAKGTPDTGKLETDNTIAFQGTTKMDGHSYLSKGKLTLSEGNTVLYKSQGLYDDEGNLVKELNMKYVRSAHNRLPTAEEMETSGASKQDFSHLAGRWRSQNNPEDIMTVKVRGNKATITHSTGDPSYRAPITGTIDEESAIHFENPRRDESGTILWGERGTLDLELYTPSTKIKDRYDRID